MRRRLVNTRVTLQAGRLPESAADGAELPTQVTTWRQDSATTVRLASLVTLLFIVIGFGSGFSRSSRKSSAPRFLSVLSSSCSAVPTRKFLQAASDLDLFLGLAVFGLSLLRACEFYAQTTKAALRLPFSERPSSGRRAHAFVSPIQACAFMAVTSESLGETCGVGNGIRAASRCLPLTPRCPARRLSVQLRPLALAFGIGYGVLTLIERTEFSSYAAMFGVIGFIVSLPDALDTRGRFRGHAGNADRVLRRESRGRPSRRLFATTGTACEPPASSSSRRRNFETPSSETPPSAYRSQCSRPPSSASPSRPPRSSSSSIGGRPGRPPRPRRRGLC